MIRSSTPLPTLAAPRAFRYVRTKSRFKPPRPDGVLHIVARGSLTLCGQVPFADQADPCSADDAKRVCRTCVSKATGMGLIA